MAPRWKVLLHGVSFNFVISGVNVLKEVVIYGAGGFGQTISEILKESGIKTVGFIDRNSSPNNPHLKSVEGAKDFFGDLPVVIGVFSPQPNIHEIEAALKNVGFSEVISPPQLMKIFRSLNIEFDRYWLSSNETDIHNLENNRNQFRLRLADSTSKDLFERICDYRSSGDIAKSPIPLPLNDQYVGADLAFLESLNEGVIVDCGAYTGDSVINWATSGIRPRTVLSLEPDRENFEYLVKTANSISWPILSIPLGVSAVTGNYSIEGNGPSARLIKNHEGQVSCVSIDDLTGSQKVSLIKMDIEGGEFEALIGATKTIRRCRPHLAISIYHTPSDLWTIGTWIQDNFGPYELDMRCYGHQGYDVVLYARAN